MGDPKSDPLTFGAWSMGHFGPFAFPGGLTRAQQHAWSWQLAKTVCNLHQWLIRLRTSYVLGCEKDAPVTPSNYESLPEPESLSRAALAIFTVPGVICYFNPNGEVLRDRISFFEVWDACTKQNELPLQLWMNVRFFNLNDEFRLMDTVGNGQLDVPDVEAIFPMSKYAPETVDYCLRNVTHYLLDLERDIESGEAMDGPDENNLSWIAEWNENGIVQPPRRVLRLYPKADRDRIKATLTSITHS